MSRELSRKLGFALILAFWALVGLTDYPVPFIDDLFYIGAALNLAQHGVFTNPYADMLATIGCQDHFFANMPLHDYVLAGWLRLFGISALSFHVLYTLLALGVSLLIFRFVATARHAWLAAIFIAAAVYGLLGGTGLRADALGLFFLLAGFDTWRAETPAGFLWRNVFLGLVIITFPNVALPAILLSLFGLVHLALLQRRSLRELAPFVLALAAAYAACFVLLLICVDGRLGEFLTGLVRNQQMSALGVRERFRLFTPMGIAKWIVAPGAFLAVVATLFLRWKDKPQRREELFFLGLAVLIFASLGLSSTSSATGAHVWAFGCLMTVLVILVRENAGWGAWLAYTAVFAVSAFGHDHIAIQGALADAPPGAATLQELRDQVAGMQPRRIYVDAWAARELYDYRLPANASGYETSSTTGWGGPRSVADLPKDAVLVVSVGQAIPTPRTPDAGHTARPLRILGVAIPDLARNPYELVIIDNRP